MKPVILDENEIKAAANASEAVGGYLENIGKSDLATMTQDEWQGFILHTFTCVAAEVQAIAAQDTPF